MSPDELWAFLLPGYFRTIAIELPILWFGLNPAHSRRVRFSAGCWLTACTYPIVVLVLPLVPGPGSAPLIESRGLYLLLAETFAPLAECALFWWAFDRTASRRAWLRDMAAIIVANLASFGLGELLRL